MNKTYGRIHSFESFSAVDGPGNRVVVFLQGCALKCIYCHNPDSWKIDSGKLYSVKEVIDKIVEFLPYIKNGGVTLSGGEPFLQPKFVLKFLEECKKRKIHTAIETAATVFTENIKKIAEFCDLFIVDFKGLDKKILQKICKVDIKRTIDFLKYCSKIKKPVYISHVVVPGISLDLKLLKNIKDFLKNFSCIEKVELLPFHKMGEYKWENLKIPYKLKNVKPPTEIEMKKCEKIFENFKTKAKTLN